MTAVYTTPVVATRTLTVASTNPSSGVSITVSPYDNNNVGSGTTQFTRTYSNNASVTLTAPATANNNSFQSWQRDGSNWSTSLSTSVSMDGDHTMTALYAGSSSLAQITSPANGSTFGSTSVTFNWSLGSGNSQYFLYVGNSPGSSEYFYNYVSGGSTAVSGLPSDNRTIYVRLWSLTGAGWQYNDYNFKACNCGVTTQIAQMTSPVNGSTFGSTSVTFNWSLGSGISQYFLYVGNSPGSSEYFYNYVSGGSTAVGGLPSDNRTIYVRLWSLTGAGWQYNDYNFKACNCGVTTQIAQMTSPANGSTFGSTSVTFNWSLGSGNSQYFLYVGNSPGSSEYFYNYVSSGSTAVSGLPSDNRTIYVRLWSLTGAGWQYNDYNFKACNCGVTTQIAQMTSPANGSTFGSTSVTFNWSLGSATANTFSMSAIRRAVLSISITMFRVALRQ